MKQFKSKTLKTLTSLALIIVMIFGLIPVTAKNANAAAKGTKVVINWHANGGKNKTTGAANWTTNMTCETYLSSEKTYFAKLKPTSELVTREGYTLRGFDTNMNAVSPKWSLGSEIYVQKNTDIYAIWEAKEYTITLLDKRPDSSYVTIGKIKAKYGSYIVENTKLPKPAVGYKRDWYYSGGTTKVTLSNSRVTRDRSIYYVDTPNTCTVTFDWNDGSGKKKTVSMKTGDSFVSKIPEEPMSTMKVFIGWSKDKYGNTGVYTTEHVVTFEKNAVSCKYYAIWLELEETYDVKMMIHDTSKNSKNVTFLLSKSELLDLRDAVHAMKVTVYKDAKLKKTTYKDYNKIVWIGKFLVKAILIWAATEATGGLAIAFGIGGLAVDIVDDDCKNKVIVSGGASASDYMYTYATLNELDSYLTGEYNRVKDNPNINEIELKATVRWQDKIIIAKSYKPYKRSEDKFYKYYSTKFNW